MKKTNKYVVLTIDSIPNQSKNFISGGYNNFLINLSSSIDKKDQAAITYYIEELSKAKKNNSISFEYMAVTNIQTHRVINNPDESKLILDFNHSIINTDLTRLAEYITHHLDSIQATWLFNATTQVNQTDPSEKIQPATLLPKRKKSSQTDNLQELAALKKYIKRNIARLEQFYQKNCLLFTDKQRQNIDGFLQDFKKTNLEFFTVNDLKQLRLKIKEFDASVQQCQREAAVKNTDLNTSINQQVYWLQDINPQLLNAINKEQRNQHLTKTISLMRFSYQQKLNLLHDLTQFNQLLYTKALQSNQQAIKNKPEPAKINNNNTIQLITHEANSFYGSSSKTSQPDKLYKPIQIIPDKPQGATRNSSSRFFKAASIFLCCFNSTEESLSINNDETKNLLFTN